MTTSSKEDASLTSFTSLPRTGLKLTEVWINQRRKDGRRIRKDSEGIERNKRRNDFIFRDEFDVRDSLAVARKDKKGFGYISNVIEMEIVIFVGKQRVNSMNEAD